MGPKEISHKNICMHRHKENRYQVLDPILSSYISKNPLEYNLGIFHPFKACHSSPSEKQNSNFRNPEPEIFFHHMSVFIVTNYRIQHTNT